MSIRKRFRKPPKAVDIEPGQRSVPEESLGSVIGKLAGFYDFSLPDFPLEYLRVLEPLAIFNPDVSQALTIWVNLGNTGHQVDVEAKNPEAVLDRLNWLAGNAYRSGGGMDGLVNHFMRQIPLMGALSAEWVVADRIAEGVTDVVIPPVRSIRFRREEGLWMPYQYTGRPGDNGHVALNPRTYSYSPMQTGDGSPYGIPPLYAALKNIELQIDALGNIEHIFKKMGLLGFLDVALEIPPQKSGESDAAYRARLQQRLKDYAAAYAGNFNKGVAVHYKDQEAKHSAVASGTAGGAKALWQLNEEQIFSALDLPPSMAGRSYSTTETYAEVDFERLVSKLVLARRLVKRFIEKGYDLDLLLRGIDADVTVRFNENSGFRQKEKAEAEGQAIDNVIKKRDAGFIDDDQAARELGYDEATGSTPGDAPPAGFFAARFRFDRRTGRYVHAPERLEIRIDTLSTDKDRREQNYAEALHSVLDDVEEAAIAGAIAQAEKAAGTRTSAKTFARLVFQAFSDSLTSGLAASSVGRVIDRHIKAAWQTWRYEDTGHLQSAARHPQRLQRRRALLGLNLQVIDRNALTYLTAVEQYYFGRGNYLARDEAAGKQFMNWLEREYIAKGLNIKDAPTWKEFRREFPGMVRETSYEKVEQIVSTTIARVQNMGQTLSLYETGFARYTIVGPRSRPICDYCRAMLGRIFDVKAAATRLANIVDRGFENVQDLPPFVSSRYSVDQVKTMSDEQLQAEGFESPPFHPKCRHRKAAVD